MAAGKTALLVPFSSASWEFHEPLEQGVKRENRIYIVTFTHILIHLSMMFGNIGSAAQGIPSRSFDLVTNNTYSGKFMKIKFLALAAITLLSIGSAQAKFNTGESHDPAGEYVKFEVSPSENNGYYDYYDEIFSFTLGQESSLEVTAGVLNSSGGNLLDNNLFLFSEETGMEFGSLSFGTETGTAYFNNLAPGNYSYEVYGYNQGTGHSDVSFSSTFTNAVPEPETYALMLGGLGMIGFLTRRRKTL